MLYMMHHNLISHGSCQSDLESPNHILFLSGSLHLEVVAQINTKKKENVMNKKYIMLLVK